MENRWHTYADTLNNSSGVAVTTSCSDIDAAFKFMNDLLDQEIHDLRFWGVEGEDYLVDENGLYYRTDEMRTKCADPTYKASHLCSYSYMPQWLGTSRDGKNAMKPEQQTSEFLDGLATPAESVCCLRRRQLRRYDRFCERRTGSLVPDVFLLRFNDYRNPGGVAWVKMGEVKHEWLPKVVMAPDFEST